MKSIGQGSFADFQRILLDAEVISLASDERWERLMLTLLRTRKSRKISVSVMERTVKTLGRYDVETVRYAIDAYLDRGVGDERYFLAIARNEFERNQRQPILDNAVTGRLGFEEADKERDAGERSSGYEEAAKHLTKVMKSLRMIYGRARPEDKAIIKSVGWGLKDLAERAEAGDVSARTIDAEATALEKELRVALPEVEVAVFTPYGVA